VALELPQLHAVSTAQQQSQRSNKEQRGLNRTQRRVADRVPKYVINIQPLKAFWEI
jgi:hypothetical protein